MKRNNRFALSGFTLLELVVVLAILAITTGLAVRALDGVEDQRRFEASLRDFEQLSEAVLGSPDDRTIDGIRTISGFVADMGRLPRATAEPMGGEEVFSLRELWSNPGAAFDIRQATEANGVPPELVDLQVLVPGGWRGPYLRLPIGAGTLLDAWGNRMTSPDPASTADPLTTGYARLRNAADSPITAAGQEIRIIRHLGANGRASASDSGYDQDGTTVFTDDQFRAELIGQVEVLDGGSEATPIPSESIVLRVFSPHPDNQALIMVASSDPVSFSTSTVTCTIPLTAGMTAGPRIVRAYLYSGPVEGTTTASLPKSGVKHVTLRPGKNLLPLTIEQ